MTARSSEAEASAVTAPVSSAVIELHAALSEAIVVSLIDVEFATEIVQFSAAAPTVIVTVLLAVEA